MTGTGALPNTVVIGVIGAGAMGAGIAQVAAAAGHRVRLYDAAPGAAQRGRERTLDGLKALVTRGKMEPDAMSAIAERLTISEDFDTLGDCALVIEAIVENLEIKRELISALEAVLSADAVIATNTSSISITSIARDAKRPGRVVGMHFFNPAPVMKLVEVISGAATDPEVAVKVRKTAQAWGKVAVMASSTPGFIVNRVARPYYAEPLRLLEEQVADPATLDALLVEGGGFRMGPFALMDLIGHDVNYAVTRSIFDAYYQDPRFRPSIVQLELVNAGHLGRKSGRGFYDYTPDSAQPCPMSEPADPAISPIPGVTAGRSDAGSIGDTAVLLTDGRTAAERSTEIGVPVILCDLLADAGPGPKRIGFTTSPDVDAETQALFVATLAAQGISATRLPDWPGLVVMRTVAMIANEAFEAVMQGVADADAVDDAMRFGVNYPNGPISWARSIGLSTIVKVIDTLLAWTGDSRYRPSVALRKAAQEADVQKADRGETN
ncbi:3-hydroxyacyl-CoA dehydrogenase PaaC [Novosphingobium sp. 11B]